MKKLLSLLLCFVLMLSMCLGAVAAYTQDNTIRSIVPGTTVSGLKDLLASVQNVSKDGFVLPGSEPVGTGYNIIRSDGTFKAVVLADVNGDGRITAADYLIIKRHFLGTYVLENEYLLAADIDEDGAIRSIDYLAVKRHFMGTHDIGSSDNASEVPILLYHHILLDADKDSSQWRNNDITISVTEFRRHMQLIRDIGYTVITMEEAVDYIKGTRTIPVKSVVLCFDDGYKSNTEYAAPILREFGYQATIFSIIQPFFGTYQPVYDPTKLQHITQQDLLLNADVFDQQCHTFSNHNNLPQQSYNYVYNDLMQSQNAYPSKFFAYPYGDYNTTVINAVIAAGFEAAFTTVQRAAVVGESIYEIPRYTITTPLTDQAFLNFFN
ncbi:MAG: hypothetical protein CVU97_00985 [Firmicutes bacterium HGW-Firmicutes-21]|nr:MAG: hypothetical protein CVU97_00985 [Firmicutes bacterium HGW-Firmicutes-21]